MFDQLTTLVSSFEFGSFALAAILGLIALTITNISYKDIVNTLPSRLIGHKNDLNTSCAASRIQTGHNLEIPTFSNKAYIWTHIFAISCCFYLILSKMVVFCFGDYITFQEADEDFEYLSLYTAILLQICLLYYVICMTYSPSYFMEYYLKYSTSVMAVTAVAYSDFQLFNHHVISCSFTLLLWSILESLVVLCLIYLLGYSNSVYVDTVNRENSHLREDNLVRLVMEKYGNNILADNDTTQEIAGEVTKVFEKFKLFEIIKKIRTARR